jgi:hypothetical protein
MLLETKSREMDAAAKYFGFRQNTDTSNSVNLHLHVWVTVGVSQIGKMGSPCGIFGIALYNDGIFVQCVGQRKSGFGFLPGVQVIGLFTTKPVGKRTPHILNTVSKK